MFSKICTLALASQVMGQETANLAEPVEMNVTDTNSEKDLTYLGMSTVYKGMDLKYKMNTKVPKLYKSSMLSDAWIETIYINRDMTEECQMGYKSCRIGWEIKVYEGNCGAISPKPNRFKLQFKPCNTRHEFMYQQSEWQRNKTLVRSAIKRAFRQAEGAIRGPTRQLEDDIETVMKARIGNLMGPINSFFQDIAPEFYNMDTCDVDTYVSCWMKRPSYERRRMMNQFWKMSDTYDPKDQCAKESGCMRPDAAKTGNARTQQGYLRDFTREVDRKLRPDLLRTMDKFRNSVRDIVQRGAGRYVGQIQEQAVKMGCDADCIKRFNPVDLEAWTQDRCNCLKNIGQEEQFVTNFEAADWETYDLLDWLNGADQRVQEVAESEYLQNLTDLDIAEEKAGFQMFYEL